MLIELNPAQERALTHLAALQQRDIRELVGDAIQNYLDAAAITDLASASVGETQVQITAEILREINLAEQQFADSRAGDSS